MFSGMVNVAIPLLSSILLLLLYPSVHQPGREPGPGPGFFLLQAAFPHSGLLEITFRPKQSLWERLDGTERRWWPAPLRSKVKWSSVPHTVDLKMSVDL